MKTAMKALLIAAILAAPLTSGFAADVNIDQLGQKFDPNTVSLGAGDVVHFKNGDDVTHNINVIDADDNADDKGLQKPGQEIVHKFTKPGTYLVKCAIHPKMKMTVTVK